MPQIARIPPIRTPQELADSALSRARKMARPKGNRKKRTLRTYLARARTVDDYLADTLDKYVGSFPTFDRLEDYDRELVAILVGLDPLRQSLGRLSGAGRAIRGLGRKARGPIRRARTDEGRHAAYSAHTGRVTALLDRLEEPLSFLARARTTLMSIPEVGRADATIVVAGAPNVGKSSLVARLSRARPRVATYAYTTQRAHIGHFFGKRHPKPLARRYQIVDTPGLVDRTPSKRNAIERQAALALRHLADLIVFVHDPSETCGFPRTEQKRLLAALQTEFKGIPIVQVQNKFDLGMNISGKGPFISCLTGHGIADLRRSLVERTAHLEDRTRLEEEPIEARHGW